MNSKLKALYDLVVVYADTNNRVLEKTQVSAELEELTMVLNGMVRVFKELKICMKDKQNILINLSFADYFDQNHDNGDLIFLFERQIWLVDSEENSKLMDECEVLTTQFHDVINRANYKVNYGCCRGNCFGLKYVNVFHTLDQLEEMLSKNFCGRTFLVKGHDGVNLDAMFFPFCQEKVRTKEEMQALKLNPAYLKYPTIIFFNPNAQFYQQ